MWSTSGTVVWHSELHRLNYGVWWWSSLHYLKHVCKKSRGLQINQTTRVNLKTKEGFSCLHFRAHCCHIVMTCWTTNHGGSRCPGLTGPNRGVTSVKRSQQPPAQPWGALISHITEITCVGVTWGFNARVCVLITTFSKCWLDIVGSFSPVPAFFGLTAL